MKKLLVALLALVAMSSMALAQAPVIGIFDNDDAVQCDGIIEAYVARDIFVFAVLTDIPAITAAEFSISNYVGDLGPACAIVSAAWNTPLVIGDPGFGIALAFSPALPGPNAFLGSINIFLLDAACIGDDYEMWILASQDSDKLVVVDEQFNEIDAVGYRYTFNCTGECPCEEGTATDNTSWGSVKALF